MRSDEEDTTSYVRRKNILLNLVPAPKDQKVQTCHTNVRRKEAQLRSKLQTLPCLRSVRFCSGFTYNPVFASTKQAQKPLYITTHSRKPPTTPPTINDIICISAASLSLDPSFHQPLDNSASILSSPYLSSRGSGLVEVV